MAGGVEGGDSFEEFLDAQLADLRGRLLLEHRRRAGPRAPLRACAQAWTPAGDLPPELPNQVEEEAGSPVEDYKEPLPPEEPRPPGEPADIRDSKFSATAASPDRRISRRLADHGRRLEVPAALRTSDGDVEGKIRQFQDRTADEPWRGSNDPVARTSILDMPDPSIPRFTGKVWPPRVFHPNGAARVTWDLVGAACIFYDAICIPLQFFITASESAGFRIVTIAMIVFWCIDIPFNFVTGFHRGGSLEMRTRAIARRYARGWLSFDVILIAFDIVLLLVEDGESPTGMFRTLRTFRVIKSLRVARMLKLPPFLSKLSEHIRSDHVNAFLGIFQMLVLILLTNHMIACVWYGLTTAEPDATDTWVAQNGLQNASPAYLYATSMHWSLTQFTPASMRITPANLRERVFNLVVIVMGMVLFSSFVSRITNTMNFLRAIDFENTKQFVKLQAYFRKHGLSTSLCVRIRGHLDAFLAEKRKDIKEKDIALLQHLSEPLRVELHYETFLPKVRHHPFLKAYDTNFVHSMRRISHKAAAQESLYGGDVLFSLGDVCSRMYFLHGGLLAYDLANFASRRTGGGGFYKSRTCADCTPSEVAAGEWLAEAALWADTWVHLGRAMAHGRCNCVTINVQQFHAAVRENKVATSASAIYAGIFVDWMNKVSAGELTDLHMPSFDAARAVNIAFVDGVEPDKGEVMA